MTGYNPGLHHRRSIRLKGYDYRRDGAYFVTICLEGRFANHPYGVLGHIDDGMPILNEYGRISADIWMWLARRFAYVALDAWVIMPDHLHGILVMHGDGDGRHRRVGSRTAPTMSDCATNSNRTADQPGRKPLGRLVGAFKIVSTKHINDIRGTPGETVWQRNYYERIIRNETALHRIRAYIRDNPVCWLSHRGGSPD